MSEQPSVSLSEIVQLALPAGSRLAAGEAELGRRVHWARLLRARPAGIGSVEAGELVILPPTVVEALGTRTLVSLMVDLIEAGVAAFVLAGEPPAQLQEACEQQRTPLLLVPGGSNLVEIERAIVSLILDRESQLRRRAEEVYGRLLATMLGNEGLPALVSALATATSLRVGVFDDYAALQACSEPDEAFRQTLATAGSRLILRPATPELARAGRPLVLQLEHRGQAWTGQLYPLRIESAWAGFLGLLGRPGQAGELDRLLADRAASLVALELAKQRAVAEATQRLRGELLDDLLAGSFPSTEAALVRARQLGYDLLSPHLVFLLSADPIPASDEWPNENLGAARSRRRFGELTRAMLTRLKPGLLSVERDGAVVAMMALRDIGPDQEATSAVERLRIAVSEALAGLGVSAGLSRVLQQPADFEPLYQEARGALEIAQRLLGGGRTVHYGRLGVERLLIQLLGNPELERFALDVLGELLRYDASHRGELVRTVEVFLACNGNHVRAAQELHLHRNTLLYRLERAREILGRDLEDAETRLALQLALRIRGAIAVAPPADSPVGRRQASRRRRAG